MIIDIHAHTSNHELWGLHTQTATIRDLKKLAQQFGVKKIIVLATYFPFKKSGLGNTELLARIKGRKLFAMFGSLDVMNNFEAGLQELQQLAVKGKIVGIKLYPGYQDFLPSSPRIFALYELAQKYSLPIMFHTGELHHCCPPTERAKQNFRCGNSECKIDRLGFLAEPQMFKTAVSAFPKVNFILSHLANPDFRQLRSLMRQHANVYTDISGQFLSGTAEDNPDYRQVLQKELRQFLALPRGVQRLLFGTDFPIQSYQDSIDLIKSLGLSRAEEERIFWRNAKKLLNL